jgi:hypothetical protein
MSVMVTRPCTGAAGPVDLGYVETADRCDRVERRFRTSTTIRRAG